MLFTIKRIEGFDVTFLKLKLGEREWITAYVRFDEPLNRDDYGYVQETLNDGEVYGIDTAHYHNEKMTIEEKFLDAEDQIRRMILAHEGK